MLAEGIDSEEAARLAKVEEAAKTTNTFEAAARVWHKAEAAKWSASHAATVLTRIEPHLLHGVGARSLADLKSIPLLLRPLKAAEAAG